MRIGRMFHRDAQTYLVHVFGRGLEGDRYVIETYRSDSDGQIHPVEPEKPRAAGRRRRRRIVAGVAAVKKLRPERDEIIVCTALNLKASGIQYWGGVRGRFPGRAPCALTGVAGHAAQGPAEEAGAGSPPPPAPRRSLRAAFVHPLRPASSRARSQSVYRLCREAPRRRPRPPGEGPHRGQAVRRPRSGTVPQSRPRRRQAPPSGAPGGGNLHVLRPPPTGGQPLRLRAVPRGAARTRPPALCRTPGRRPLRALQAAHSRRSVALRPVPRAGEGARLSQAKERRREETLCREARAGRVCGLCSPHRGHSPLSALRI